MVNFNFIFAATFFNAALLANTTNMPKAQDWNLFVEQVKKIPIGESFKLKFGTYEGEVN